MARKQNCPLNLHLFSNKPFLWIYSLKLDSLTLSKEICFNSNSVSFVFSSAVFTESSGKQRTLRRTQREPLWELTSGENISCLRWVQMFLLNRKKNIMMYAFTDLFGKRDEDASGSLSCRVEGSFWGRRNNLLCNTKHFCSIFSQYFRHVLCTAIRFPQRQLYSIFLLVFFKSLLFMQNSLLALLHIHLKMLMQKQDCAGRLTELQ